MAASSPSPFGIVHAANIDYAPTTMALITSHLMPMQMAASSLSPFGIVHAANIDYAPTTMGLITSHLMPMQMAASSPSPSSRRTAAIRTPGPSVRPRETPQKGETLPGREKRSPALDTERRWDDKERR